MKNAMKPLMAVLTLSAVLWVQPAAWADPLDGFTFSVQGQGRGGAQRGNAAGQARQPPREARPAPPPPPPRGQLTPEERRQLHRDLDKANRELYGGNRR